MKPKRASIRDRGTLLDAKISKRLYALPDMVSGIAPKLLERLSRIGRFVFKDQSRREAKARRSR